ncbi:glycosyl transferase [Xenococcus sp. PCC 7305]|uniref:glycosyltransferase family 2 protein n=1 Tax=Xenococcus sp. PCC 7305 TaxID=102125 RepID=UPI0002AC7A8C|nr:glycosyltransferase family 2 protein [Xenococcus sp. PCC 7305]ELS01705.1 glycosyl transferase [Xenococcus sp. PCC 7305]
MSDVNQANQEKMGVQDITKQDPHNLPLVSIITVVFNGESELEETIQSVIRQSYNNIEYIIIDGASNDKTLDIIRRYEPQISFWCSEKDEGIYDAMNKGIKVAQGQLIGLINCGDTYLENAISEVVNIYNKNIQDNPLLVITGAMYRFDPEKNHRFRIAKSQNILDSKINRGMPINHPATFITKDTYEKLGLFKTKYRICGDYDLVFRLYHSSLVQFVFTQQEIANMKLGGVSEQFSSIWIRCQEHFQIRKNNLWLLHNLWICVSFYMITAAKFILKKTLSDSLVSFYYAWRHRKK